MVSQKHIVKSIDVLLEENGSKSRVESTKTLILCNLAHAADETICETWFRDETNTCGFERAEGNVGKELGACRRGKIDGGAVVGSSLVADQTNGLLLEELVSSKLECALEEVTSKCWADTGQKSTGAFICNDLTDAAKEAAIVGDGIKLDFGLDTFFSVSETSITEGLGGNTYTSIGVRPP